MKKTLLFIIILFHLVLKSQTFNGNLGSQSLNWNMDQKDFNTIPRDGIAPMSIKLWDNYLGANAPSQFGSLLEINGRVSHLDSQLYFTGSWDNGRILYRSAFYGQNAWQEWRYLLDSKNDIESSGNLKIQGNNNSYILYGNVGIGTITPNAKLDIFGNSGESTNIILAADYPNRYLWRLKTIDRGNAIDLDFTVSNNADEQEQALKLSRSNSGRPQFQLYNNAIVANNGNVGIGTANPTSKLTVAGNINSREVKVTVDAGADFVFENNYNLPSLDAVEKFIKENRHLPEIASADVMKKDGINLSEMNIKLLQKIEELTLYTIEQEKNTEKLTKVIEALTKRLEVVESK